MFISMFDEPDECLTFKFEMLKVLTQLCLFMKWDINMNREGGDRQAGSL